jgi:hypothetical protein
MRNALWRVSGLLAVMAISAASACAGNSPAAAPLAPSIADVSPFAGVPAARSILVMTQKTTSGGVTSKLPGIKVQLWLCKSKNRNDWDVCTTESAQRTTIARGTTDKNAQLTMHATFNADHLVCIEGVWAQKLPSGGKIERSIATCPQPFPKTVILEFVVPGR